MFLYHSIKECPQNADIRAPIPRNTPKGMGKYRGISLADCHARLGNLEAALADCAALRDDHWTPGVFGAPAGTKAEVTAEIRRLALALRRGS